MISFLTASRALGAVLQIGIFVVVVPLSRVSVLEHYMGYPWKRLDEYMNCYFKNFFEILYKISIFQAFLFCKTDQSYKDFL